MARPPVILVADDDESVREMLVEHLSGQGFAIVEAADAKELLARLEGAPVDLLLLDRTLPDGDSLRLVPGFRRKYPALGIVVLTALVQDEERVRGLDIGADDYIGKPFHWKELTARIQAVLRRSRRDADAADPASGQRRARRREAVILFADAVGFTRLVHDDEATTLRVLNHYLQTVVAPGLVAHGGRLVKTLGDGFLAELPDAATAVGCARDLQRVFRMRNARRATRRRLAFRMGLHRARVLVTADGDLLGDGVNLAARLQAEAPPGGIVVSAALRDALAPEETSGLIDLGTRLLKHVAEPQRLYAVADELTAARPGAARAAGCEKRRSRWAGSRAAKEAFAAAWPDPAGVALYASASES